MPLGSNGERRTNNDERNDDRCCQTSVIFDPNICHELFRFNKLSRTHTHPPNSVVVVSVVAPREAPIGYTDTGFI
jgi:hypothetical protein